MKLVPRLLFALALLLACAVSPGRLPAQPGGAQAAGPAEADPLADLTPDLHAKVDGIMEKAAQAKRAAFAKKMKGVIETLMKGAGITGEEARKALETAARDAGEESVKECIALARKRIGRSYQRSAQQMALSINATVGTGGLAAVRSEGETPPDEQTAWTGAVQRVLTPEQLAAWKAKIAEDEKKENQEIDKLLDTQINGAREQLGATMRAQVAGLTATLELSPERAAQLDALGKSAVEQSLKAFRLTTTRTLRSIQPIEQRQRMVAANRVFFIPQGDDAPTTQAVWKDGLTALLTDADRQRLRDSQRERQTRRTRALGRMLLSVMDDSAALTASQRERLQEPAERAARQEPDLFPSDDTENYYQFSRESFFAAAARVPEAETRGVLDAPQWQHWQQACKDAADGRSTAVPGRLPRQAVTEQKTDPLPNKPEPEEIERLLSDGLYAKTGEERRSLLAANLLKAEDAARVAGLDEKAVSRLQTAARGMTEEALALWKAGIMQNVRNQMENGDAENVRALLASLSDVQFPQVNVQPESTPTLWDKTVERELSAPQRAAWRQEQDARTEYRDAAVAALILAEFDRRYQLTTSQWETLPPLLQKVMREYGPDIHRMFAYSAASTPWYFQTFTMFLPLLGIPDDELLATLGKERWDRWSLSQEHANGSNYWPNVRQFHVQRKKENGK